MVGAGEQVTIRAVGVIGLGTMGSGIAQVCASHGYEVLVLEAAEDMIKSGLSSIEQRLTRDVDKGRLTAEIGGKELTKENLMRHA